MPQSLDFSACLSKLEGVNNIFRQYLNLLPSEFGGGKQQLINPRTIWSSEDDLVGWAFLLGQNYFPPRRIISICKDKLLLSRGRWLKCCDDLDLLSSLLISYNLLKKNIYIYIKTWAGVYCMCWNDKWNWHILQANCASLFIHTNSVSGGERAISSPGFCVLTPCCCLQTQAESFEPVHPFWYCTHLPPPPFTSVPHETGTPVQLNICITLLGSENIL